MATPNNEREYVLRTARENDVKFIRLWFTDILGSIKGFAITVEELENALVRGMGFDGAAIEKLRHLNEKQYEELLVILSEFHSKREVKINGN